MQRMLGKNSNARGCGLNNRRHILAIADHPCLMPLTSNILQEENVTRIEDTFFAVLNGDFHFSF